MKRSENYYSNKLKKSGAYEEMSDAVLSFDVSIYQAWKDYSNKVNYIPERHLCPVYVKLKNDFEISAIHFGDQIIKPTEYIISLFYNFMINKFGEKYTQGLKDYLANKSKEDIKAIDKMSKEILSIKQPE